MKRARYLVFAGNLYYPSGGADDLVARVSEIDYNEIAGIIKTEYRLEWLHVYDSVEGRVILRHTNGNSFYEESTDIQYINFTKILEDE